MEDWDQEELERVIADKHAKEKSNATDIICKFFLDAVEKKQYGWYASKANVPESQTYCETSKMKSPALAADTA